MSLYHSEHAAKLALHVVGEILGNQDLQQYHGVPTLATC